MRGPSSRISPQDLLDTSPEYVARSKTSPAMNLQPTRQENIEKILNNLKGSALCIHILPAALAKKQPDPGDFDTSVNDLVNF